MIATLSYKLRLAFLIYSFFLLSGCALTKDPQSYMRLPQLPEDKESLKQVIQDALPSGAELARPKRSKAAGSIFVNDLNKDGTLEAIVYYKAAEPNKGQTGLTGMLWQQSGNTWKLLEQFQGEGYDLDTLLFDDVTNNGATSVLAGYSGGAKVAKGLVVYRLDGPHFTKILETPYSEFIVDDMNQDKIKDLSIVTLERTVSSALTVFQYGKSGFQALGATPLDPYVNGYTSFQSGWIKEAQRGLVLEAGIGAHSASTQLVYFEQEQLIKAFPDKTMPMKPRTSLNGDFNKDGIVEIGIDRAPKGWEKEAYATTPWVTAFYRWDGQQGFSPSPLYEWFMDIGSGFYFEIPAEWKDSYVLQRSADEGIMRFISNTTGAAVEWKTMPEDAWTQIQTESPADWLEVGRTAKTVTALRLTEAGRTYASHFHRLSELEK